MELNAPRAVVALSNLPILAPNESGACLHRVLYTVVLNVPLEADDEGESTLDLQYINDTRLETIRVALLLAVVAGERAVPHYPGISPWH